MSKGPSPVDPVSRPKPKFRDTPQDERNPCADPFDARLEGAAAAVGLQVAIVRKATSFIAVASTGTLGVLPPSMLPHLERCELEGWSFVGEVTEATSSGIRVRVRGVLAQ